MRRFLDDRGSKASLKEMAGVPVALGDVLRIAGGQGVHDRGQGGVVGELHAEMDLVGQEDVGEQLKSVLGLIVFQQIEVRLVVSIGSKERRLLSRS
jgi:hypothetical protein